MFGEYVAVVGTDGSGKTTMVGGVARHFRKKRKKVCVLSGNRFGFQVLPLNWLFTRKKVLTFVAKKKQTSPGLRGVAAVFVYYVEFLLRYVFIVFPKRCSHDLVIQDRSFLDLFVSPHTNKLLTKFFAAMLPKPRYVFVYHDLSTLYQRRKSEHTKKELAHQLRIYRSLRHHYAFSVKTDSSTAVKKVSDFLEKYIMR